MSAHRKISVELGERSYPIVIGDGMLGGGFDLTPYVHGDDCLIVSNVTVAPLYAEQLKASLPGKRTSLVELPDGESHKTLATLQMVLDALVESGANRDTTVIALGGGVVGDIAGFAAASYMRGVSFIQVPTTLLATVDSSVGGKTGVNHPGGKNLIGAFHQPMLVMIDTDTLRSLPDRELKAGMAEVIKHGAIADVEYLDKLEANMPALLARDATLLADVIERSCEIKAGVVAEDEREAGRRAILNFGHTFGHAIEKITGYGKYLHGEAVAIGMLMAADLSGIAKSDIDRLEGVIAAAGLPTAPPSIAADDWMQAMGMDKKVQQKKLRFILLKALGDAYVTADYDAGRLEQIVNAT